MLERLRSFSRALGSVPSLIYALVYLGLIPFFAAVYYFALPDDFYHATVQFERGPMGASATHILAGLRRSILLQMNGLKDGSRCGAWLIDRDQLSPYGLTLDDEKFAFSLRVILWGMDKPVTTGSKKAAFEIVIPNSPGHEDMGSKRWL